VLFLTFAEKLFTEKEYRDVVRNTILGCIPQISDEDLDDCFMNVFTIVVKKQVKLENHPDIHGWLAKTTQFEMKHFIRNKIADNLHTTEITDDMEFVDSMCIESLVESNEFVRDFMEFIKNNLKSAECELLQLKCIERRSNEEIAKIMDIKRKTVDVRITRLREKIRNLKKIFNNT
jgi:RNA polymerase sigma factor (sigma-70 family)